LKATKSMMALANTRQRLMFVPSRQLFHSNWFAKMVFFSGSFLSHDVANARLTSCRSIMVDPWRQPLAQLFGKKDN
jgi:hypothetical protein